MWAEIFEYRTEYLTPPRVAHAASQKLAMRHFVRR